MRANKDLPQDENDSSESRSEQYDRLRKDQVRGNEREDRMENQQRTDRLTNPQNSGNPRSYVQLAVKPKQVIHREVQPRYKLDSRQPILVNQIHSRSEDVHVAGSDETAGRDHRLEDGQEVDTSREKPAVYGHTVNSLLRLQWIRRFQLHEARRFSLSGRLQTC